jgi:hypothetical protein
METSKRAVPLTQKKEMREEPNQKDTENDPEKLPGQAVSLVVTL